ncbi:VWA domain-containing protein [Aestuariimicrobium ganziense]|uniref:VWA domain-containing protein n=1 Tax=Aestuariimicrobium ganziense TaxID=2773677 RepID=UPI0038B362C6
MHPMILGFLPSFSDEQRLWTLLVVPLLVAAYIWVLRRKHLTGMRFTNTGVLGRVLPKQSSWRRHVAVAATLLSLVALVFAWARPEGVEKVARARATVVVVIDVSHSMQAKDVSPDRLSAAKKAATEFILQLPPDFNVAVVALSGKPETRLPPSTDRGAAQRVIAGLELQDATAIGTAIDEGLQAITLAPPGPDDKPAPAVMVLLSDGQNTEGGSPLEAARKAKEQNVKVYTIAYGTETGYVDLDGKRERVAPDKAGLAQIAQTTDAKAWTADSAKDLTSVYKDVRGEVGFEEVKKEITAQWAFYAFAFAVIAALGAVSMAARWPS